MERFAFLEKAAEILVDHACGRSAGGNAAQHKVKDDKPI
jgi:hypothetical protein